MKRYTIGKMAKLNNVSEQTLRLYDKIGLFKPAYVDEKNGYRLYDIGQSARLDIIQYLKNLGMTLKEIKEVFDYRDLSLLQEKLEESKGQIDLQIKHLREQKEAIQRTIDSFELFKAAPKAGMITLEFINKRTMLYVDKKINIYDYDLDVYESLLREFKDDLIKQNLPPTIFFNPGTILRKEHVEKREFISSEIFVFINDKRTVGMSKTYDIGTFFLTSIKKMVKVIVNVVMMTVCNKKFEIINSNKYFIMNVSIKIVISSN